MCEKLGWKLMSKISKTDFVNKTLIWIIIVPIFAKLFSTLENTLEITIQEHIYTINLELPFSWSIFYFSAFFFLIGNILYKLNVPSIINDNESYADFHSAGKGKHELLKYIEEEKLSENGFYELYLDKPLRDDIKHDVFWEIWKQTNHLHCPSKIIISIFYTIAISLLSFVFFQNMYFVYTQLY